jgi:hypothetical protein
MGVNETSVKIHNGFNGDNELELRPNPFHGTMAGSMTNEIVITVSKKVDDAGEPKGATLHVTVKTDELLNAISLIQQSYYDEPRKECCDGCGRGYGE